VLWSTSCKKDKEEEVVPATIGDLVLEMNHMVNNSQLTLNTGSYTNALGQTFSISKFDYYVSNIVLTKTDGSTLSYASGDINSDKGYFLVKSNEAATKNIRLTGIPVGDYSGISFTIGVDSTRNVSGAQSGSLDPTNGMFWSWNTGYIFLKLEGKSNQSGASDSSLVFHIGGFKDPNNTIRSVSPDFNGATATVRGNVTPTIHVNVKVNEMLTSPEDIDFSSLYFSMGGANSVKIANNYRDMFIVDHIHND
jgi:hypothetical protein